MDPSPSGRVQPGDGPPSCTRSPGRARRPMSAPANGERTARSGCRATPRCRPHRRRQTTVAVEYVAPVVRGRKKPAAGATTKRSGTSRCSPIVERSIGVVIPMAFRVTERCSPPDPLPQDGSSSGGRRLRCVGQAVAWCGSTPRGGLSRSGNACSMAAMARWTLRATLIRARSLPEPLRPVTHRCRRRPGADRGSLPSEAVLGRTFAVVVALRLLDVGLSSEMRPRYSRFALASSAAAEGRW